MRRALPKPGAWMDTMKQIFAFPMYASAAWLLWVLAQQTSSIGLGRGARRRDLGGAGGVGLPEIQGLLAWRPVGRPRHGERLRAARHRAAGAIRRRSRGIAHRLGGSQNADEWQPYDAARVQELNARGAPLLVNFTASWCLTCLVNERNAFADAEVQQVFHGKGVTLMKGDWTNRDPAITKALADFGRAGVPLYVVYNSKPGSAAPVVLPQLLTRERRRRRRSPPCRIAIQNSFRMGHAEGMASDNAGSLSVIDFRRLSMVLQWHVLGGTWTAYDAPPSLVHGVALIRAGQPNICVYGLSGRLRLQVGPDQYALSENSPRIKCTRGVASFGLRRRFTRRIHDRRRALQPFVLDQ